MELPKDAAMLLSFINTQLRDNYPSLRELTAAYMVKEADICDTLAKIDYHYDEKRNQFV